MRTILVALLASSQLSLVTAPLTAQPSERPSTGWGFISLGAASMNDSGFYASALGGGYQRGRALFMARIMGLDTKSTKRVNDWGLLAGIASRPRRFHVGAAIGLGVAEVGDTARIAVPIEAHATIVVTNWAAIGARFFASGNELAAFSGIAATLQLGRVRTSF